MSDIDIAAADL